MLDTTLFPYTRPSASVTPSRKPAIIATRVRRNVICKPSRSFGNESSKKSKKLDVAVSPHSSPYKVAILPRNSFVL